MSRIKRGVIAIKKRKKILKLAKGYRGARCRRVRIANEQLLHSLSYAYRDRRVKKRDFRKLWIVRINAAIRSHGLSYNRFMHGLKQAGVAIDRKMLADMAVSDEKSFKNLAELAKQHQV